MSRFWLLIAPALVAGFALSAESTAVAAEPTVASATLTDLSLTAIDGTPLKADALQGKAVLFVNVASQCGFTPQYEGLQALYESRKDDGLVIVGVPCNQFGGQEPGSAKEIQQFCKMNYGVEFPLLEKQEVNGSGRSALYQWLVASEAGGGADIGWNFEKFLVDPSGAVVARFPSRVAPDATELTQAIDKALEK
jgi:glutathione peroxidase